MKATAIIFHSNILSIYDNEWIKECLISLSNQTFKYFDIFELNYGNDNKILLKDYQYLFPGKKVYYWNRYMKNHSYAMNFLLDKAFLEFDYDIVYNVNLDDIYDIHRFEYQNISLSKGYDLISSNYLVFGYRGNDVVKKFKNVEYHSDNESDEEYIIRHMNENNNIICHPVVAYSRHFWKMVKKYEDAIPEEDYLLWKKGLKLGLKFKILPEYLLFYRNHNKQITSNYDDKPNSYKFENREDLIRYVYDIVGDKNNKKKKIGIISIATGSDKKLIDVFYESLEKYFMPKHDKKYYVFTDTYNIKQKKIRLLKIHERDKRLNYYYKYHLMMSIKNILLSEEIEIIYFCDIGLKILQMVSDDFLPTENKPLIGVAHSQYYKISKGNPERRKKSAAYIDEKENWDYYIINTLQGGLIKEYLKASNIMKEMIDKDRRNNIIPILLDESILNRYMVSNINLFKIYDPGYSFPKFYNISNEIKRKIIGKYEEEQKQIIGKYLPFASCEYKFVLRNQKYDINYI